MKTTGKVLSPKKNDFDIVSEQLSQGLSRLAEVRQNAKLSAEQQIAMDKTFRQIELLKEATAACGQTERFAEPMTRNDSIRKTIAGYDSMMFDGFDKELRCMGYQEALVEQEAAGIDRNLAVQEMVSGIRGTEGLSDMSYQGY